MRRDRNASRVRAANVNATSACAARLARPLVAVALLLGVWSAACLALDPAYLDSWPTVNRVLAEHQGKDTNDTLAVQMAALHVMRDAVEYAAGSRRWHGLTADEQRLRGEYYNCLLYTSPSPRDS